MARNYSNIALDTTLVAGIAAGDLSLVVSSASGWPTVPFAAVIDPGSLTIEEVVQVTNVAGTTFTITRAFDGTTAAAHANGATVRHSAIAGDFTDLQAADTTNATAITTEASTRAAADLLRLLIANYDWSTLPNAPTLGALALLSSITASLIADASANGRTLITAANYAAMRALLSLVIGTDVQAQNANLAALAGLTLAADRSVYSTGVGSLALYTLSSFARTLLDDADAAVARATMGAAPAPAVTIHTTTVSGWAFPSTATYLYLEVVSGGGGGGSGRRGATTTFRGGGGGGAAGSRSWRVVRVADLGGATTLDITVGAGGAGGAARTTNDTDGLGGAAGGNTTAGITSGSALLIATAGGGGAGGTTSAGSGGSPGTPTAGDPGNSGGAGSTGGAAAAGAAAGYAPGSGGGGAGITNGDVAANGAAGGQQRASNATGGTAGTAGGAGGNGTSAVGAYAGAGGGGGASSTSAAAGAGGNGGAYGGGGGGGAASQNGNNSGAGGAGGQGVVVVMAW